MQIYFHSRLWSYLPRVPILVEGTVYPLVSQQSSNCALKGQDLNMNSYEDATFILELDNVFKQLTDLHLGSFIISTQEF